jgi:hypothetical protein
MGEPKVLYYLRHEVYDSQILAAEAVGVVAAAQDLDDTTGYAGATEALGASWTTGAGGPSGLTAVAARLEHPRNVLLVQVVDGLTAGNARVLGIGMDGRKVDELFTLKAASGTLTGNVPFLRVDRVNIWGVTGTLTGNDHLAIGTGAKIGLPMGSDCVLVDVVKERFNNVDIAVTPANIDRTYGTYVPTSTLDGAKILELWYTYKRVLPW